MAIMGIKEITGIIGAALGIIAFAPYIISILKGKTKPHMFSWLIWTIATLMVGFATLMRGGGNGAYIVILSGALSFLILFMSLFYRENVRIYRMDWVSLILALIAMPIWYFTQNPFWAVAIMTFIDLMAYFPTIRKIKDNPYSENLLMYGIVLIRNMFIIAATDDYNITTMSFHILTTIATSGLVIYSLLLRRNNVKTLQRL